MCRYAAESLVSGEALRPGSGSGSGVGETDPADAGALAKLAGPRANVETTGGSFPGQSLCERAQSDAPARATFVKSVSRLSVDQGRG